MQISATFLMLIFASILVCISGCYDPYFYHSNYYLQKQHEQNLMYQNQGVHYQIQGYTDRMRESVK